MTYKQHVSIQKNNNSFAARRSNSFQSVNCILNCREGGRKRFWSQLNNSNQLEIDHVSQRPADRNSLADYRMSLSSNLLPNWGSENRPFKISTKQLQIGDNSQHNAFENTWAVGMISKISPNPQMRDPSKYVRSLRGQIAIAGVARGRRYATFSWEMS